MIDMPASSQARLLTAEQAAARLRVSRQTLYAYVSRGLLRTHPADAPRQSRYLADEVDRLAEQRAAGRKPKEVARAALNWGTPVLSSSITLITDGRLYYRGYDAIRLARSATVEAVAALLWDCPVDVAFGRRPPDWSIAARMAGGIQSDDLLVRFAAAATDEPTAQWQRDRSKLAEGCGALLRTQTACLLGTAPDAALIHSQCGAAWQLDDAGADLVRSALVLCADHELNASSFTARCVASTGASLRAAVIGGLAALSGPKHGGTTARIETFWDTLDAAPRRDAMLRQHLSGGESVPGFGHPLYADGDVRATLLLDRILPAHPDWQDWIGQVLALTGQHPNIDLALVALRRHLGLRPGTAFGLFALGRSIGWIAHAMEQRRDPNLIRPRAVYAGLSPE